MQIDRFRVAWLVVFALLGTCATKANAQQAQKTAPMMPGAEYSGMYSFLREGEFVQISVEEKGRVTGFISRYGDQESDRGAFLDHFFKPGKLEGNKLSFTTETVHGVWFEFRGIVERGEGKNRGDEAFYLFKGTLIENSTDENKKASTKSREVTLKSFPDTAQPAAAK